MNVHPHATLALLRGEQGNDPKNSNPILRVDGDHPHCPRLLA